VFCANLGYRWGDVGPDSDVDGVLCMASAIDMASAVRRDLQAGDVSAVLFDPQVYMAGLPFEDSEKTCARLATYPWFPVEVADYESGEMTRRDWLGEVTSEMGAEWPPALPTTEEGTLALVRSAIDFQSDFGVTHVILPAPLISEPDSDLAEALLWVDAGLEASQDVKTPILATLAVSDVCLLRDGSEANPILSIAVDQLSARPELSGVYVVLEQSRGEFRGPIHRQVCRSLLTLSHVLGEECRLHVFVNFAAEFGLACLGAGAKSFASGYENKCRRLHLPDFVQRGGGGAFPRFVSLGCLCEYLPGTDLERIRDRRLLRLLQNDRTLAGAPLLDALQAGRSADNVVGWRESRNNVAEARRHYLQRLSAAARQLASMEAADRARIVYQLLQDAERDSAYLDSIFQGDPLWESGTHVGVWRAAYEDFLGSYDLA